MSGAAIDSVESILELYERRGASHYGEGVSQLAHALQTAALAVSDGATDELVCAALLHDVGHLVEDPDESVELGARDDRHELVGSRLLGRVLGSEVATPVALHVVAKRWRCAVDDSFERSLSPASRASLRAQGGPLGVAAQRNFEANPSFDDALKLRAWDDCAKALDTPVPAIEEFHASLLRLADAARSSVSS